jgi:2-methylisocitrate lyase-like PEP mutase family enzyme
VTETTQAAAATGLAGCSTERHTGRRGDPIVAFGLAVDRIEAAVQAMRAPRGFVLTASCENLRWGRADLDDTTGRLEAFERAGADVLYAPALQISRAFGGYPDANWRTS